MFVTAWWRQNSCYILTCHVKLYIYIKKHRDRGTETENHREWAQTKQIERKCDFHIRYRGENIAKGLPPFRKNWRSM